MMVMMMMVVVVAVVMMKTANVYQEFIMCQPMCRVSCTHELMGLSQPSFPSGILVNSILERRKLIHSWSADSETLTLLLASSAFDLASPPTGS